jgi:hypothetical protein
MMSQSLSSNGETTTFGEVPNAYSSKPPLTRLFRQRASWGKQLNQFFTTQQLQQSSQENIATTSTNTTRTLPTAFQTSIKGVPEGLITQVSKSKEEEDDGNVMKQFHYGRISVSVMHTKTYPMNRVASRSVPFPFLL